MAGRTGLEPATSGVTDRRSDQLNYRPSGSATGTKPQSIRQNKSFFYPTALWLSARRFLKMRVYYVKTSIGNIWDFSLT